MDTIDAILQAAYELFSERGYERTPVSEIAKQAGVAAGTIIYHFKTKDNLLRVLNWLTIHRLYSHIRQRTQLATDGMQATCMFIDEYFLFLSHHHREMSLLMETEAHAKECRSDGGETLNMDITIETVRSGLGSLLENLVREGSADGSIRPLDAGLTGLGILALLMGAARLILLHDVPQGDLLAAALAFARTRLEPLAAVTRHGAVDAQAG